MNLSQRTTKSCGLPASRAKKNARSSKPSNSLTASAKNGNGSLKRPSTGRLASGAKRSGFKLNYPSSVPENSVVFRAPIHESRSKARALLEMYAARKGRKIVTSVFNTDRYYYAFGVSV